MFSGQIIAEGNSLPYEAAIDSFIYNIRMYIVSQESMLNKELKWKEVIRSVKADAVHSDINANAIYSNRYTTDSLTH